mmetsp:Transcript_23478/g.79606  ORF Transcript_23478/g.79606 Transcript_23478/m.79606 type:complete len:445 (+) Transcript_23478:586-1920(+)
MHGGEGEAVLVVHDVTAELRARVPEFQVRSEEARLLHEGLDGRALLVEEPGPVGAAREDREADLLNGHPRAFVRHARIHVAVEDDGRVELWGDPAVEIDHALRALGCIRVAGGVAAGVLPSFRGAGPLSSRRALQVQCLLHLRAVHPLRLIVVLGSGQGPVQRRRISEQVQVVDVRMGPLLGHALRGGREVAPECRLALRRGGGVQRGGGRLDEGRSCGPTRGLAEPTATGQEGGPAVVACVPQEVEVVIGDEAVLVRVPQHVHGLALRLHVCARVAHRDALDVDLGRMEQNLLCERGDIDACVGLTCDEEAVGSQLRELRCEEVLQRGPRGRGRGDVGVGTITTCLHGGAVRVADPSRALQDQQVRLLGPSIWVPHEAARGVDEQGPLLLHHAKNGAASRAAIQPQNHGRLGGLRRGLNLSVPIVEHRTGLRSRGIEEAGPLC